MTSLLAHERVPLAPHDLPAAWNLELLLVLALAIPLVVYGRSVRGWWTEHGRGAVITPRQVAAFGGAVGCLVLALVSPLDALSGALFSAHMVQHLLLTLGAAPLLLLGRAHVAVAAVLPLSQRRRWSRRGARALRWAGPRALVAAVLVHVIIVLAWHVPTLYDLAVDAPWIHAMEHATLLVSAVVFWGAVGATGRRPVPAAGIAIFVASFTFVLLAALLTSAQEPWYAAHVGSAAAFGLTPVQDQHLAAAIMWVPGGIVYLAAGAAAIVRWIRSDERDVAAASRGAGRS